MKDTEFNIIGEEDLRRAVFFRDTAAHKGLYGRTLVIAGSEDIYGACFLCALACFKSGAGLVKIVTHENNRYTLQHDLPEAMYSFYDKKFKEELLTDLGSFDTVVTGPGLSASPVARKLLEYVVLHADSSKQFLIFDADALNLFAKDPELFERLLRKVKESSGHCVFTPHEGELKRLAGGLTKAADAGHIAGNDTKNAENKDIATADIDGFAGSFYERTGIVLVRKGSKTRIYGRKLYMNVTGNDGMATAGSGDVLAGIMGGALKRYALGGESDFAKIVAYTVFLHGYAGNLACSKLGPVSMMARDIVDNIRIPGLTC